MAYNKNLVLKILDAIATTCCGHLHEFSPGNIEGIVDCSFDTLLEQFVWMQSTEILVKKNDNFTYSGITQKGLDMLCESRMSFPYWCLHRFCKFNLEKIVCAVIGAIAGVCTAKYLDWFFSF